MPLTRISQGCDPPWAHISLSPAGGRAATRTWRLGFQSLGRAAVLLGSPPHLCCALAELSPGQTGASL